MDIAERLRLLELSITVWREQSDESLRLNIVLSDLTAYVLYGHVWAKKDDSSGA